MSVTLTTSSLLKFMIAGAAVAAVASKSLGDEATLAITIDPVLPFSDINILVVSDVHSFVGGHPHEPDRNADYGDLFSFHERLKAHCDTTHGDLFLFNNGDWLHGTGLAMDGNSTGLLPIVAAMPWDAMAMGRQEATYSDVLRDMNDSLLPVLGGKYITTNVIRADTKEPYGDRYQLLKGSNSTVLVVGLLYDVAGASETIEVLPIRETIQQDWFRDIFTRTVEGDGEVDGEVLAERYDAIVVMAHMDNDSPLIDEIYDAIRPIVDPQMPIQFITGHSHKRERTNSMKRDKYVHRMEPGGVFDTIGWVTIPKFETARGLPPKSDELQRAFRQEFLNTSKTVLHSSLGLTEYQELRTEKGTALSNLIYETQERLGLHQIVACPQHDYFRNISIHAGNSLWKLWREHVVRREIFEKDEDRVMLVSKSSIRYDLKGSGKHNRDAMTLDDVVAIAPYMEKVVYVGEVPDWMIRRMNNTFNTFSHHNIIPDYVLAGDLDSIKTADTYKLYTHEVDVPKIKTKLEKFNFHDFVLTTTGQRDTLYWLDYLRTAFPCPKPPKDKRDPNGDSADDKKDNFTPPYFFDPDELEEEATDGKVTGEDLHTASDGDGGDGDVGEEGEEETWTLPPNEGYQGYIPGHGETKVIPIDKYSDYESKEDKEQKKQAAAAAKAKAKGLSSSNSRNHPESKLYERKKTRRKLIKGFALILAGCLLLVPVVCLVLQVTGKNDYYDDYDDVGAFKDGMYDREDVKMLQRHRRRGTLPTIGEEPTALDSAPFREIEII